jgi:putative hemolysin
MIECLIVLICLIINALLAAAEVALISLSRSKLREEVKQGNRELKLVLELRENPERTLSIIQVGITFVGVIAAAVTGAGAGNWLCPYLKAWFSIGEKSSELLAIFLISLPFTYLSVVFGELVPKTLALRRPLFTSLLTAPYLQLCSKFISPVIAAFETSTKTILSLLPHKHIQEEEYEVRGKKSEMNLEHLSPPSRQYVLNIFRVEQTRVKEIFVPWEDTIYIHKQKPIHEVEHVIVSSGHTRLPVVEDDRVIGILNAKELLAFHHEGNKDWQRIIRPVIFLEEATPILTALRRLQDEHSHMAVVTQNNHLKGVITMEAIFEEIVGDIYDEDDDGALKKILSAKRYNQKFKKNGT